jgi:hypothetical protein
MLVSIEPPNRPSAHAAGKLARPPGPPASSGPMALTRIVRIGHSAITEKSSRIA